MFIGGKPMQKLMGAVISVLVAGFLVLPSMAKAESWLLEGIKTVDHVDLRNETIVVGDIQFRLTSATRVYTSTGSLGTLQQLRKGMKVQVNTVKSMGSGSPVISEIRITPGN